MRTNKSAIRVIGHAHVTLLITLDQLECPLIVKPNKPGRPEIEGRRERFPSYGGQAGCKIFCLFNKR